MFMVSIATFEWTSFRILNKIPKSDALIIFIVSLSTVFVDLAIAVILGVIIAALVFAWDQGKKIKSTISINKDGHKIYALHGALFFGSVTSFKELFDPISDPNHIVIDFSNFRVYDHSGLDAINNIAKRYSHFNKNLHLLNLSKECASLLDRAHNIVEVSIINDLNWHLSVDKLA